MKGAQYQRVFANRSLPHGRIYLVARNQTRVGLAYDFEQLSLMKLLRTNDLTIMFQLPENQNYLLSLRKGYGRNFAIDEVGG
jgi:hypothetical protein